MFTRFSQHIAACAPGVVVVLGTTASSCDTPAESDTTPTQLRAIATTTLTAAADSFVRSNQANTNYGSSTTMELRLNGQRSPIVRFDATALATAAAGQTLVSATLELTLDGAAPPQWQSGQTVYVHRITASWDEATVTWNSLASAWDSVPTASATITGGQTGTVAFDVTNDVTSFLAGQTNDGWVITYPGQPGDVGLVAREAGNDAPRLVLELDDGQVSASLGGEVAIATHLAPGDEHTLSTSALLDAGRQLFDAVWTPQEGGGRPLTKGVGSPLSDPLSPLVFPRNFNRISAPDANSCTGCHAQPFGISGGGGDIVANVFVLGHRFDFVTFDPSDTVPTRGAVDELGDLQTLGSLANSRATLGMFGSGYIEMLARQITVELQAQRDALAPGQSTPLTAKGISFGTLARDQSGAWVTDDVVGLPAPSLATSGAVSPPSLVIRPFHQAGAVVSLRQFTNNAFNHHHGIQSQERFGTGTDPDGDGFVDELTIADVTAATVFQATMAVPGRVIPNDPAIEDAVAVGEALFDDFGCSECHRPALPLTNSGWIFTEPSPFNPPGNLQVGETTTLAIDLSTDPALPTPRLPIESSGGADVVLVPAFTDFRLHDLTDGPGDPNAEPIDMQAAAGTAAFFAGNRKFLTRKLWGVANEPPYFHHGMFTTMRQAILAHGGEASATRAEFIAASDDERDAVIEFLKTLQVLPPGTSSTVVDETYQPKSWP